MRPASPLRPPRLLAARLTPALAFCLCLLAPFPLQAADTDKDGVDDAIDNCLETANPDQIDTNLDGIGNRCDADLNNDNIVNNNDVGILAGAFGRKASDPGFNRDADLDGNGVVNNNDVGIAAKLFGKRPGPSLVKPNPEFVTQPPDAASVQLFRLGDALPNGDDGAVFMRFPTDAKAVGAASVEGRSTILFEPFGRAVTLNDLGLEPDVEAGDGVFSAFLRADFNGIAKDASRLDQRVKEAANKDLVVSSFSGRRLAGQTGFNLEQARLEATRLHIDKPFKLPSGIELIPLPFEFDPPVFFPFGTVSEERSLVIRDLSVIADPTRTFDPCDTDGDGNTGNPTGPWSFRTLMTNMANTPVTGITAQQFVHAWLSRWLTNDTVNGDPIPNRAFGMNNEILSQIAGWNPADSSTLDLDTLPFRLLAIVNRIDLSKATVYGPGQPGETRLVFGLLQAGTCQPHPQGMSVIFEYGDVERTCTQIKNRANLWLDLDTIAFPSAAYNAALQALTDTVTLANAAPGRPNRSAINQVRTNDVALNFPWEFREFRLLAPNTTLAHDTLKQTPRDFANGTPQLRDFINANQAAVLAETHQVPNQFPAGTPFMAARSGYQPGTHFRGAPVVNQNTARHKFSLNTCAGCHAAEALDPNVTIGDLGLGAIWNFLAGVPESFYHVDARTPAGLPVRLSRFMTGTAATQPFSAIPEPAADLPNSGHCANDDTVSCTPPAACAGALGACVQTRHFDDLARRAQVLQELASASCLFLPRGPFFEFVVPLRLIH